MNNVAEGFVEALDVFQSYTHSNCHFQAHLLLPLLLPVLLYLFAPVSMHLIMLPVGT
ncbi:hypothetical protein [Pseudoalteromonas rubra]|uniref:hypothetical protein n=1 Tax=Pseudoalteromonas rubra TaxID=43658 RepID=UPI0013EECF5C|nr:hypothetical protein [Pseudoalteromonas rubra]